MPALPRARGSGPARSRLWLARTDRDRSERTYGARKVNLGARLSNFSVTCRVDGSVNVNRGGSMSPRTTPRPQPIRIALLSVLALALVFVTAASAGQRSKVVAKEAQNESLGSRVLTRTNGHTLYSLSVETKGRFVCTGGCLGTWTPLTVPAGVKPKGPVKLGTIKRSN